MSIPWMIWAGTLTGLLLTIRNPIYLGIILIGLLWLGFSHAGKRRLGAVWLRQNVRFILTMILLSALINTLFTHTGSTPLVEIPKSWPLVGGKITLEGIVFGAINGLVIANLYLLFNIINLALPVRQLLNLVPRAFHPIAMVTSIALTFFPSIQKRAQEIKEAQIIRGNPMKKAADWLPLLMPLMITSLENAIQLSESMTARGFSSRTVRERSNDLALVGLILGTFLFFSAWILQIFNYPDWISTVLYLAGGGAIITTVVLVSNATHRTRYRAIQMKTPHIVSAATYSIFLIAFVFLSLVDRLSSFQYTPYPTIIDPEITLLGMLFCILPILPGILSHDY
jgi:energy-coupling factor transport system permease protein